MVNKMFPLLANSGSVTDCLLPTHLTDDDLALTMTDCYWLQ